ncbi:MAG: tetratricopeptide repeat protein, partial [Bacteroidota bacterium]
IAEEAFPVGHSNIGGKLRDLAGLLGRQDRFAEAEALYVRGYEDALDAYGPDHPTTQAALRPLPFFFEDAGKPGEAERYRALQDTSAAS